MSPSPSADVRERLVTACDAGQAPSEAARLLSVDLSTVYRWRRLAPVPRAHGLRRHERLRRCGDEPRRETRSPARKWRQRGGIRGDANEGGQDDDASTCRPVALRAIG